MQLPVKLVSVVGLGTFTAVSSLISLAFVPIVLRFFDQAAYGLFATFLACAGWLNVPANLGFPPLLAMTKDEAKAKQLLATCLHAVVLATSVSGLIVALGVVGTAWSAGEPIQWWWLWLIPLTALSGAAQALEHDLMRQKKFKVIGQSELGHNVIVGLGQVLAGFVTGHPVGLAFPHLVSMAGKNWLMLRKDAVVIHSAFSAQARQESRGVFKEHFREALPICLSTAVGISTMTVPILAIATLLGPAPAGVFAVAWRVVFLPVRVVGRAIDRVYLGHLNTPDYTARDLQRDLVQPAALVAIASIIPMAILAFFGPELFGFVFGEQWTESGNITRWLAGAFVLKIMAGPANNVIIKCNHQDWLFRLEFVTLVGLIITLLAVREQTESLQAFAQAIAIVLGIREIARMGLGFIATRRAAR